MEILQSEQLDTFEHLLKKQNELFRSFNPRSSEIDKNKLMKATAAASFDDFVSMVNKIVKLVLKKHNVEFLPDEGGIVQVKATSENDHPFIQYVILDRVPRKGFEKPHAMERFLEQAPDGKSSRHGMIYRQVFDYTIQFNIIASDYIMANTVMNAFEEAMFTYAGFFKEKGVSEVFFLRQLTDSNLDEYRNTRSVRSLQYRVTIERNRPVYDTTIAEIDSAGEILK